MSFINDCILRCRRELGIVLESIKEHDTAAECLMTAIDLEGSTPVLPFSTLMRVS